MAQTKTQPTLIRAATPEDAPSIAHLGSTVFSLSFGHSMPANDLASYLSTAYTPSTILSELQDPQKSTLVVCPVSEPTHILGFATLTRGTTDPCLGHFHSDTLIELQRLYVAAESHGRGLGTGLMRKAEEMAREQGCKRMWLGVWEENTAARRVYERVGYRRVGEHEFVVGSCVQTDWILVKEL